MKKNIDTELLYAGSDTVEFQVASEHDISWLCQNMPHLGSSAEMLIRQQFNGDDMTIIGVTKTDPGELAFFAWISHDDFVFKLLGSEVVSPGDFTIRRLWVPSALRKRGLSTAGKSFILNLVSKEGIKTNWSIIDMDNVPSLKLQKKLSFEDFGEIKLLRRFGRSIAKVKFYSDNKWHSYAVPKDKTKL